MDTTDNRGKGTTPSKKIIPTSNQKIISRRNEA
jgi:hypothetical protein